MTIDPNIQLEINDTASKERDKSDGRYAKIIVERIVFAAVALISIAVVGALVKLVVTG